MAALDELFKQARHALDQRDWSAAKSLLAEIILEDLDYTGALDLLKEVQKREKAKLKYQEGLRHFQDKNWEEAIRAFDATLRDDPDHADAQAKLNEAKGWLEVERLRSEIDEHKRRSEWGRVAEALELLLKLQSFGLDLDWDTIEQQLTSVREEAELKQLYQAGEWHFEQRNWLVAQQNFGKLKQQRSDYPGVASKLEEIQKQLDLEELYRQAQEHERVSEWSQAIDLYLQVLMQDQNYPAVMARMAYCKERLDRKEDSVMEQNGAGSVVGPQGGEPNGTQVQTSRPLLDLILRLFPVGLADIVQKQPRWFAILLIVVIVLGSLAWQVVFNFDSITLIVDYFLSPTRAEKLTLSVRGNEIRIPIEEDSSEVKISSADYPELRLRRGIGGVTLQVDTVSTNKGGQYTKDELRCDWAVAPINEEIDQTDTGVCELYFLPSQKHSTQIVSLKVEGRGVRIGRVPRIVMELEIVDN